MTISARTSICATLFALVSVSAFAVKPQARITSPIENSQRAELPGTLSPHAHAANDRGALAANTPLSAITLVFSRTAAQQQALDTLIQAQQDPASPQYHQFLTPEQFGAQFGVTDADVARTKSWLEQQGFNVQGISRSRDRISFAGTAAQVASAFGATLHNYATTSGTRFAPSTALNLPSALASSVLTITNLSSFRPRPHVKFARAAKPRYTSGQSGNVFLGPLDLGTIYDVNATYSAGYNGAGQAIAVVGQSAVVASDITHFQAGFGYTAKAPTMVLVPGTGTSTIYSGDEAESDLDLEYSGAMAPGATIYFVYAGSSTNASVFDSVQYAVQNATAPIISISYGECELDLGAAGYAQLNAILQQAAAQGQTVVSASGDNGSTDCFGDTGDSTTTQESLSASFPASSQYVTGLGGTEIPSADLSSTYFNSASGGVDLQSSAKSYVPEQVWNDSAYLSANGDPGDISAGGGGTSIYTTRPTWQTGVPGIPTGTFRTVPDVSLLASPEFPGYIYCSSDTGAWFQGQAGSCTSSLRDASTQDFTVAGGTSFAAPIFAGLIAVLNQAKGYSGTGQGLINPTLYTLASSPTTYASAFHDITSGGNECGAGISYCSTAGAASYFATTGYDEASGLGSIDFTNLVAAWPGAKTTAGSFTLSATNATIAQGSNGNVTLTATPSGGYTGTLIYKLTGPAAVTNACYSGSSLQVTGTAAATANIVIYTAASSCASNTTPLFHTAGVAKASAETPLRLPSKHIPGAPLSAGIFLGFLALGFLGRRSRHVRTLAAFAVILVAGYVVTGCSNSSTPASSTPTPVTTAPKGTYTIAVSAYDSVTSSITASTTFTLTID